MYNTQFRTDYVGISENLCNNFVIVNPLGIILS